MGKFGDFLLQAGQSIVGGALGLALGSANDKRQLKQQQALNDQQYKLQTQLTDYNQLKQMQMWRETNYKPQMEQLKLAGLNPALIYGMSGGGGASTNIAQGNITAPHAPTGGGEVIAMAQTAAQLGLMRAQRENIEADTKLKEATATKTSGVDTEKAATEIQSLTQGIQNQKAQQALTEVQTQIGWLDEQLKNGTLEANQQIVYRTLDQITAATKIMQNDKTISDATVKTKIAQMQAQLSGTVIENALKQAQTANVKQDTLNKVQQILNETKLVYNTEWQTEEQINTWHDLIRQRESEIDWEQSGMPKGVKDLLDHIFIIPGAGGGGVLPIKGFHNRK